MQNTAENTAFEIEVKLLEKAAPVLNRQGLSLSKAISIFLRQVVLQDGLPRNMIRPPLCLEDMTGEELAAELQKGLDDVAAGRTRPAKEVFADMKRKYGI